MAATERLDLLLVARGLVESREKAQALLIAGRVYSGERRLDKPGARVAVDLPLMLRGDDMPWVSRGGLKLVAALDHFAIDPAGMVALDIGASTGGFTDVLLARGARRVHAV
ncbi:MAG: SAM-dependent methyltransferase, partial [Alphaproteobacteria bacterium]